ncbi:Acetolactate synthase large subunit [Nocardia africana]|uniref:acetolactate synthase n=1 Tax=Nocardia africana TaxID=134964 RepID=A0A378WKF0_9NOCA|nr:Acetolactate synthase large subunit [Nocardia africana]
MPTRVVDYLVQAVSDMGVRHIFGVDGANIEDLYDAAYDASDRITAVVAKHEFAAATMADGYARTTAGLGVVCATSGGGAMNLVAGLAESHASRIPVLALVGQAPTDLEGKGAFQDSSGRAGTFDAAELFDTISLYCARVETPASLPAHLSRAVAAARAGGPAVLLLPKDIQQAELVAGRFVAPRPVHGRDDAGIERLLEGLRAARAVGKVVIIAGAQVARDDARDQLRDLAAVLDAGVGVAPDAKDVYDCTEHGFLGVAGSMGHTELADALRGSALCLLVGTRMPVTARAGLEAVLGASTASVGGEPPYVSAVHATSTDLATTLRELTSELKSGAGRGIPVVRAGRRIHYRCRPRTDRACGIAISSKHSTAHCIPIPMSSPTRAIPAHRWCITSAHRATAASSSPSAWAAWATLSAPPSAPVSPAGTATTVASGAPWSWPATAPSTCTAWRFTPRSSTGCR